MAKRVWKRGAFHRYFNKYFHDADFVTTGTKNNRAGFPGLLFRGFKKPFTGEAEQVINSRDNEQGKYG